MGVILVIACFVIPFAAEAIAVRFQTTEKRRASFFLLAPVAGLIVYLSAAAITAHAYMALAASALFYFGLVAISNRKVRVLRDPLNAHDFDVARNVFFYPEFYVGYVGWPIVLLVTGAASGLVVLGLHYEDPFPLYGFFDTTTGLSGWLWAYGSWPIVLGGWLVLLGILRSGIALIFNEQTAVRFGVTLDPQVDIARLGLFPAMMLHRLLLKETPPAELAAEKKALRSRSHSLTSENERLPDIIAIEGESYFDLERLFAKLEDGGIWHPLRELEKNGVQTGQLQVEAWGAYTMRTEFSFLSGIANADLGFDAINPYTRFARQKVATYVSALKQAGYRTICVHPAKREFFRRNEVIPNLGFDEFVGLEAFKEAEHFGRHVSDKALGDQIEALIADHHASSKRPIFVFAITIESHGPWAPGRLQDHLPTGVTEQQLIADNPTDDHTFALYHQHMNNMLDFFRQLTVDADTRERNRVVALFGDHLPALGELFDKHAFDEQFTDYLLWNSQSEPTQDGTPTGPLKAEAFFPLILQEAGLTLQDTRR